MSARAASRLEGLGFVKGVPLRRWESRLARRRLPSEAAEADQPVAGDVARRDVRTCRLGERPSDVIERTRAASFGECVVVNDKLVVLGVLASDALDRRRDGSVEELMGSSPPTVRATLSLEDTRKHLGTGKRTAASILLTTADGELIGLVRRDDVARCGYLPRKK
jgi:hypothetical protein